ncbi:hypothetical protein FBU30_002324 [Linnemannia zychae]|nr:hypothetical protein FBU30_002324 [Linnemannia zychae]
MASGKDTPGGASKTSIDLYDGDDLLDYGDDLEADLLAGDLANVEAYDDLELGVEDELGLDLASLDDSSKTTAPTSAAAPAEQTRKNSEDHSSLREIDDLYDIADYDNDSDVYSVTTDSKNNHQSSTLSKDNDASLSKTAENTTQESKSTDIKSEVELGGINRQNSSTSDGRTSYTNTSTRGNGRGGGLRGRGNQGYGAMGGGRGNYQGSRGPLNMMGMGMNQQQIYANMQQQQMGMSMGMGMGMNNSRFPGDGYGNQGMGYPYVGMGMSSGSGGMGTPGRTIHINPKFQNRAGVPGVQGALPAGLDRALGSQQQQQQQQQQGPRQSFQDSGSGQSSNRGNQFPRSGSQDRYDNDRLNRNKQYISNDRGDLRDGRDQGGNKMERGRRDDTSYRSPGASERELSQGLSTNRGGFHNGRSNDGDNWPGDSPRRSQPNSPLPRYNDRLSPATRGGSPGSNSSQLALGAKRPGGMMEDSQKAHKSSGNSTPRSEQNRSNNDSGSVSFLRDRRDGDEGSIQQKLHEKPSPSNNNAAPTGFVRVDNIPESVSEASIYKLAHGISGVERILVGDFTEKDIGNETFVQMV